MVDVSCISSCMTCGKDVAIKHTEVLHKQSGMEDSSPPSLQGLVAVCCGSLNTGAIQAYL